ncbi:MAG: hypothetical protein F9K40_07130 [Kofleriaceae bacterium]|nr:MAG: hypothetical protein F9K40_07130 [Kofleriaceae bacterium]MBZ0233186.1 hypothetical protein [Kofleriaceae bacterium]
MSRLASMAAFAAMACGAACGGAGADDPFTQDMKMICAAGQGRDDLPPEMRRVEALKSIADKVKTPEAARFMAGFASISPRERAAYVKGALEKAKLSRCPLLDQW